MLKYILRRTAYSVLIIIGVLIITFLLFRISAGDPAATVLGKNPSPREIEDLRVELGADKPLFFGYWCKTDCFTNSDFTTERKLPGCDLKGKFLYKDGGLEMNPAELTYKRNFPLDNIQVKLEILFRGNLKINGTDFVSEDLDEQELLLDCPPEKIVITADNAHIKNILFYRKQDSPFNSQLLASIGEIIQFSSKAPYVSFLNFGRTLITREPVRKILWRGMWPSLFVMVPIFCGELLLAIAAALFATAFKGSWIDRVIVLLSVAGMSVSYLVFIIFGQWYLGYYYNLFPVWGWGGIRHLILPVIIGILSGLGGGVRFYRTVFVNELNREYLRTATAKGCSMVSIYVRHLLRNSMIQIITRATAILPFLFTGSLLLETFFGIPGLGYTGVNALMNSDLQLVKALVIVSAFIFVIINLLADIAYAWADPRMRLR